MGGAFGAGLCRIVRLFLLAGVVFFCLDIVWLGIAGEFYGRHLAELMADRVYWPAAVLFYLIYIAGLVGFVIRAVPNRSAGAAGIRGAGFGFVVYAAYELTNFALIRGWPALVVAVDILWGTLLSAGVSAGTMYLDKRLPGGGQ